MQNYEDHIEIFKVIEERLLSSLEYFGDGRIWLAREKVETILEDVFSIACNKD